MVENLRTLLLIKLFYPSGRFSIETEFLLQLFRRQSGANEVKIIAEIPEKVLANDPFLWGEYKKTANIRHLTGDVIPGFDKIKERIPHRRENSS